MPSMPEPSATSALQAISNATFGANTLKSLLDSPLHFEKSGLPVNTGISGRYTPLNNPVHLENGTTNGPKNGVQESRGSSLEDTASPEASPLTDIPHINGDKAAVANLKDGISTEWARPLQRPPGLRNFGNTCYMNSTLQALMHVPPLVTFCINRKHEEHCSKNSRSCIFCRFERHARDSYPPPMQRQACLDPAGIVGKQGILQKFYSYHKQEDSHEFLIHLLDKLDEAEKKAHRDPKHKSIIQEIFSGECRQSIICERDDCRHVSHTSQAFMDLSLDLLIRDRDILSSLADFTKQETLSQDNQYKCEKCNGKSRAKKVTRIHKAPPILMIHLKRFAANGMRKNQTQIQYPEVLDLSPYMSDESRKRGVSTYRLIATICHHALDYTGMRVGHYTANCKSASGTWNHFDDAQIGSVKVDDVLRDRDAYILFYARDNSGGSPIKSQGSPTAVTTISTPTPTKSLVNGFKEPSHPPSSGLKRSFDDYRKTESPSKRPRLSDDEEEQSKPPFTKREKSREPLSTVVNGLRSPASPPGATKSPSWKPFQAPNGKHVPSKSTQSSSPKPDLNRIGNKFQFSKDSVQQRSGKPIHRIKPLSTTDSNPYIDNDPFASGVYWGHQRQNEKQKSQPHPRPRYPGIGSQLPVGATPSFNRQEKTLAQRIDLGIHFNQPRSGK